MTLTREDVRQVAALARLSLSDEEEARMATELSSVLDWMEKLRSVDVGEVAPLAHVHAVPCPLRADEARPSLPAEEALEAAPEVEEGAFLVPPVLEQP